MQLQQILIKELLILSKARLAKTKHRLICARCGKWERVVETNEVKNILICPYCKARQITATYYSDYDLPKIIQKNMHGKKLSSDEKHKFNRAWKVSSLIENFGKTAITVCLDMVLEQILQQEYCEIWWMKNIYSNKSMKLKGNML